MLEQTLCDAHPTFSLSDVADHLELNERLGGVKAKRVFSASVGRCAKLSR
jgi:hypothetical protein